MSNIIISCLGNVLYLIIQRWGRAYRDNSFHECINTNNGTEALNKALKYTYLPRGQRSINLSKIVTLLVETFLPALRQKYLFANFEQSNVNRRYKDEIPKYLHNKPKAVILHCLDRKASSACFCSDDITDIDATKRIFQINSTDAHQYTVNFIIPSCSCPDWTQHHYPCKHFFAIFRLRPQWDWNTLPQPYLASPRLSLDTDALNTYFSDDSSIKVCEPTQDGDMGMGNQQVQTQEDDSADLDFHSAKLPMRKVGSL